MSQNKKTLPIIFLFSFNNSLLYSYKTYVSESYFCKKIYLFKSNRVLYNFKIKMQALNKTIYYKKYNCNYAQYLLIFYENYLMSLCEEKQ